VSGEYAPIALGYPARDGGRLGVDSWLDDFRVMARTHGWVMVGLLCDAQVLSADTELPRRNS